MEFKCNTCMEFKCIYSNTLLRFYKYVMEPKGFLIHFNRDIACALNNFGHKQHPYNSLDQNNSIQGVYGIPS
jgi:hypothetical protein